jgi:hypothetical protein
MAIQDEMYKKIVQEIDELIAADRLALDEDKIKSVAKMLTELSVGPQEADSLVAQYMAQIKILCKK